MADTRHKNVNWTLPEGTPGEKGRSTHLWDSIHAALLMDIRDELQRLNHLLHCQNFQGLPHAIRRIDRRLAKKIRLR